MKNSGDAATKTTTETTILETTTKTTITTRKINRNNPKEATLDRKKKNM